MSFWSRLFGGPRRRDEPEGAGEAAPPPYRPPRGLMRTPKALEGLMQAGACAPASLGRRCCHREDRGVVWQCPRPATVVCGGCGNGTCAEPYHAYGRFCTLRGGSIFETTGSKFFYRC